MDKSKKRYTWVVVFGVAILHWIYSFFSDTSVGFSRREHLICYLMVKLLYFFVVLMLWKWIYSLVEKSDNEIKRITLYALPYFLFLIKAVVIINAKELVGDEANIYNNVIKLDLCSLFTYFTGLTYAVSLMLIPHQMGVVFVKIFIQSMLCGYVVNRTVKHFNSNIGLMMYIVFLLRPTIENALLIHRMQWYGLLFLFLAVKMIFDYIENKDIDIQNIVLLSVGLSVLTFWRREGIYLLLFAPIIISLTYRCASVKKITGLFLLFFASCLLIYSPQYFNNISFTKEETHTYNSWIVNMSRKGFDKSKYGQELLIIDKCISLEAIDRINHDLGAKNYEDEYIAWREGYVGVREDATNEAWERYKSAVRTIIIHEPITFIKTRIGLWLYTSLRKGYITAYNLNIPIIALIICLIYAINKKRWMFFWLSSGLLLNTFITVVFAPAAYFKYYYHTYLVGWFLIVFVIIYACSKLIDRIKVNNYLLRGDCNG